MSRYMALSLCLLILLATPVTADDTDENELKEKTVMITVNFKRGQPREYGTGVVLCQEDDRAWILTANHVFAGKSTEPWKQIRLSRIEGAKIAFYRNSPPPIEADTTFLRKQMSFYTFRPEDLLLLSVPLTQKLPSTATLSPPPSDADEQNITAQGYWKDKGLTWTHVAGELAASRSGSTKFLYHTGEVHEGFSGGPLFNQLGELIGINLQRVPGNQTPDGESDAWYGKAQVINNTDVLSVMDKWMPAKCFESASQLTELAFYIYKKAMQSVSIRRWADAETLLREAIQQKPVEGGSVHLEGMRYTQYLPHYHLGVALLNQGNYSDAIREFDRSEAQQVIHDDKRYKKLKKKRLKAYEELRRQAVAATTVTQTQQDAPATQALETTPVAQVPEKKETVPVMQLPATAPVSQSPESIAKPSTPVIPAEKPDSAPEQLAAVAIEKPKADMSEPDDMDKSAPPPQAFLPTHIVTANTLRVRRKPDPNARTRSLIHSGDEVQLLDNKGDWSLVTYSDSDGVARTGWVATRFVAER